MSGYVAEPGQRPRSRTLRSRAGPVWIARFASEADREPASEIERGEWVPFSEARDYARLRGYEFNEG